MRSLFILLVGLVGCGYSFSDSDIERSKSDIRKEFERRGMEVSEVNLIKESPRHLTGYIKGTFHSHEIYKVCNVNASESNGSVIWECK